MSMNTGWTNESLARTQGRSDDNRQSYLLQHIHLPGADWNLTTILQGRFWVSFTDEQVQAQRYAITCPRERVAELGLQPRLSDSESPRHALPL